MSNKNKTHITAILDRSGSMRGLTTETIGGFNRFINEQKDAQGSGTFTMVLFDDKYEVPFNGIDLDVVPVLTTDLYSARGMTSLYDAIGKSVRDTENFLSTIPEDQRPGSVIFLIVTDGQENSSKEFAGEAGRLRVQEMVKNQTEKFDWNFIFMAANIDAKVVGDSLGVDSNRSFNYSPDSAGTEAVYSVASSGTLGIRNMASAERRMRDYNLVADPNAVLGTLSSHKVSPKVPTCPIPQSSSTPTESK